MKKRNFVLAFVSLFSMFFSVSTSFVSASENVNVETFETDELIELTSEFGQTLIVPAEVTLIEGETDSNDVKEFTQVIDFDTQNVEVVEENISFLSDVLFKKVSAAGGNSNVYGWDSTGGVKGNITVSYLVDSAGKYKITSISGGYQVYDSATQVVSQSVISGCSGGGITQRKTYSPSSSSWSFATGFTQYVKANMYSVGGATNTIKLKRNSSQWTMTVQNLLFQAGGAIIK